MKRFSIYTLSLVFLVFGVVSCGKSTKGKLVNEWKVTSLENRWEYINPMNIHIVLTTSMTENSITETSSETPTGGSTVTNSRAGTVNKNEFTIKKDGTWSWSREVSFTHENGTSGEIQKMEQSGTWSFVGKTKGDDFKKNERVLFNIESVKSTQIQMQDQVVIDTTEDQITYTTGQNVEIYLVKESKKNKLELEQESKRQYADDTNTNSESHSWKLTLETK